MLFGGALNASVAPKNEAAVILRRGGFPVAACDAAKFFISRFAACHRSHRDRAAGLGKLWRHRRAERLECPLCGQRVCTIYHLDGRVACWRCNGFRYAAQRTSRYGRKALAKRKIRRLPDGEPTGLSSLGVGSSPSGGSQPLGALP